MLTKSPGPDCFNLSTQLSNLSGPGITLVEYIWVDGTQSSVRSKTRVVKGIVEKVEDLECRTFFSFKLKGRRVDIRRFFYKPSHN
jgi:hypothetical protein